MACKFILEYFLEFKNWRTVGIWIPDAWYPKTNELQIFRSSDFEWIPKSGQKVPISDSFDATWNRMTLKIWTFLWIWNTIQNLNLTIFSFEYQTSLVLRPPLFSQKCFDKFCRQTANVTNATLFLWQQILFQDYTAGIRIADLSGIQMVKSSLIVGCSFITRMMDYYQASE